MFEGLKQIVHLMSVAERERAYLDQSVDGYDLERRQREIDRGRFSRRNRYPF